MARVFSVEEGNLQSSTISSSRAVLYKDIDLTFTIKPSGEIYKKLGSAAVKQAVKNLLLTNFAEKPFNPQFGADLRALLFELADDDTADDIETNIRSAIETYEPRAQVLNIKADVAADTNSVNVSVTFLVLSTSEEVTFTSTLARLR